MKKIILCILLILAASSVMAKETITFWYGASPDERIAYEQMIKAFEKQHPDIAVNGVLVPQAYVERKLTLSIAGKVPPDVVRFYAHLGGGMMSRGALEELDSLVREDGFGLEDFYPAGLEQNTYKGVLYGLPWVLSPNALYYNKALFREAGLDPERPPKTWQELREYARKLTKYDKDGKPVRLGFSAFLYNPNNFAMYLWQLGGELVDPETQKAVFNTREGAEALRFMSSFIREETGDVNTLQNFNSQFHGNVNDPFGNGAVAMFVDNPYKSSIFRANYPDLDYGIATVPYGKYPASEIVGNSLVIPRGSRHKRAAWEFIKFAASREQMIKVCSAGGRIPARRSAATDDTFCQDPIFKGFIDQLPYGKTIPIVPGWAEASAEMASRIELYLKGKKTEKETLDEAEKRVNAIIAQADEDMSGFRPVNWRLLGILLFGALALFAVLWTVWTLKETKGHPRERRETGEFYLMILPWIIGFVVLTLGSVLASLVFSFSKWDVINTAWAIGFRNFAELFRDEKFVRSIWVTTVYTLWAVPLSVVFGLLVSVLLNKTNRFVEAARTLYYLPSVISGVATSVLWINIFAPSGLLNNFLGLHIVPWIERGRLVWLSMMSNADGWLLVPKLCIPAFVIMSVWSVGSSMIIYLAALQGVPAQLYEAADLDGAGGARKLFGITLPLITPAIFYQLITGIIFSLQMFTQAFILNNGSGGPEDASLFYGLYLYNQAFSYLNVGKASAMAWMLFLVVMLITLINFKLANKWVYYESES
ncbi:MAG: extracellular solute-binding protein [Abditibacteriota bacterium]|nr:extracellular solute-binding protein [Abditibacteriota bacterium]